MPALTLASQEAAFERARAMTAQLELQVASSREQLHRTLGLHGARIQWRLAGKLAPPPDQLKVPTQLETQAIERSLELAELRNRLTGLARRQTLNKTQGWLPDVSVNVRMGEIQGSTSFSGTSSHPLMVVLRVCAVLPERQRVIQGRPV